MNRYFVANVKTEHGEGIFIVEVDSNGWATRQAEIYSDKILSAPKDMNLYSEKLPEGLPSDIEYKEVPQQEFYKYWARIETKL